MELLVFRGSVAHVVDYMGRMLLGAKAVILRTIYTSDQECSQTEGSGARDSTSASAGFSVADSLI